jgi:signal transduction histidine kinase
MSGRSVSVRSFLVLSGIAPLALTVAAATVAIFVELHSQRSERADRLATAAAFVEHRRAPAGSSGWQRTFARRLAGLELSAELAVVLGPRRVRGNEVSPEKRIFLSDALRPGKHSYVNEALRPDNPGQPSQAVPGLGSFEAVDIGRAASREYTFPFWEEKGAGGMLRLRLYAPPLDRTRQALVALTAGLLALLVGVALLTWTSSRWFVRPLRRLSSQVDSIAGGELAVTPPPSRIREVTNISSAVSGMAEALARTANAEAQLDAKRRFLISAAAHDLRTPLFSLRSYLDAIATGIGRADEQLEKARAKAGQIDRLVTSLFAYARADLDDQPHHEAADLADAVGRASSAFELAARGRRVTLRLRGNGPVPVTIDRDRFERAIANILDNALRYTPDGGVIDIAYGRDDGGAYVRIDDHGPGIEPELLPHVFEPMVRADGARNHTGGAGLGLTIAARLLEAQGGTIRAANRPEGGASLTLRLPPLSAA